MPIHLPPARAAAPRTGAVGLRWQALECWLSGLALFILSGAVFMLLIMEPNGELSSSARKTLQLLSLPVYGVAFVMIARRPRKFVAALRSNLPLAILLTLPFLSVLWSISPSLTLRRAIGLDLSLLLAYALAIRFSPRQLLILVCLVLGTCMVLSLAIIPLSPHLAFMPGGTELRGVFNHKNVLGWNAALGVIATGALATDRHAGLRPLAIALFAASAACLLLSQSATSMGVALSAVPFALFYRGMARANATKRLFLIVLALLCVVALIVSLDLVIAPFLEGFGKDMSLTGRVPLWALVDHYIGKRLLFGYGYQAFWSDGSGDAWVIWTRVGWPAPHAHNGYRDALLSMGLAGAVLLLAVIARAVRQGAALHCRHPDAGWLWLNVVVGVFLVMNLTESLLLAQNSFLFTLFVTGIIQFSLHRNQH